MSAKKLIIQVIENWAGEYIPSVSRENLNIGLFRGKIKLTDVPLDGDLIGSHVLGAVGLSGFGVLSCHARELRMTIPWGSLEKEPTKFELTGVHLVCVPLAPGTTSRTYGAGTADDPKCALRTRAKRAALARLERNFFAGRIPGEGPSGSTSRHSRQKQQHRPSSKGQAVGEGKGGNTKVNGDVAGAALSGSEEGSSDNSDNDDGDESQPNNSWLARLRRKIFRNIEMSVRDAHIRCEVPEGGLKMRLRGSSRKRSRVESGKSAFGTRPTESHSNNDERAFAFGCNLGSVVIRTSEGEWDSGASVEDFDSPTSQAAAKDCVGTAAPPSKHEEGNRSHKVLDINGLSVYWDDSPPVLVSESELLVSGGASFLTPEKVNRRVAAAMEALRDNQDPGSDIISLLSCNEKSTSSPGGRQSDSRQSSFSQQCAHSYCCKDLSFQLRATFIDRGGLDATQCLAELSPCRIDLDLRPWQYMQYQRLRTAMFAQQRLDTMLHKRPDNSPRMDPRAWWRYIIACVVARPDWRPWRDVRRIVRSRARYLELVRKQFVPSPSNGNGRHRGLSEGESLELLRMEEDLPIEALLSFHLLALRRVDGARALADLQARRGQPTDRLGKSGFRRSRSSLSRIRRALVGSSSKGKPSNGNVGGHDMEEQLLGSDSIQSQSASSDEGDEELLQELSEEKEPMHLAFKAESITISVRLFKDAARNGIARVEAETSGIVRSLGDGKKDLIFDVTSLEAINLIGSAVPTGTNRILTVAAAQNDSKVYSQGSTIQSRTGSSTPQMKSQNIDELTNGKHFTIVPETDGVGWYGEKNKPVGVVCRVLASIDSSSVAISVSANPATLIGDKVCLDALADFFSNPAPEMQSVLRGQLRNAATPLAHKAQLALMAPVSMSLRMDVDAPKLWVPISSHLADGAIFLDIGRIKMNLLKPERVTETKWDVFAREMQLKYVRGISDFCLSGSAGIVPRFSDTAEGHPVNEISVVRPFQINVVAHLVGEKERKLLSTEEKSSVSVTVGDLDLNLADVDILASAIGKWYAAGILRMKERSAQSSTLHSQGYTKHRRKEPQTGNLDSPPLEFTVSVKRIEMMLECCSKAIAGVQSDRRTYLVSLCGIEVGLDITRELQQKSTFMTLEDAKVVQIAEKAHPSHQVLARTEMVPTMAAQSFSSPTTQAYTPPRTPKTSRVVIAGFETPSMGHPPTTPGRTDASSLYTAVASPNRMDKPILRFSYLHDGLNHLDEIEIFVEPFTVCLTPTSLKDFLKGAQRVVDLGQLITAEMERKIHEQGRSARRREHHANKSKNRPASPDNDANSISSGIDSSLMFRLTVKDATILAGRPFITHASDICSIDEGPTTDSAIQILFSALIMFQSVENADSSGSKTLHISAENLSTTIGTTFEPVSMSDAPPSIGPTAAEIRVVYSTVNQGIVISQELSIDCDTLKSCVTPSDISTVGSVIRIMTNRMKSAPVKETLSGNRDDGGSRSKIPFTKQEQGYGKKSFASLLQFKKKGTGIATSVRFELQTFSFVLLRPFSSHTGVRPLFDMNGNQTKGKLDGCLSALSGECSSLVSAFFFNSDNADWEYAIEPFDIVVAIEQMPNELALSAATPGFINMNFTGALLKEIADIDFDSSQSREGNDSGLSTPVSTAKGQMRLSNMNSISIQNDSGLDLIVYPVGFDVSGGDVLEELQHGIFLNDNASTILKLDSYFGSVSTPTVSLGLAPASAKRVGQRKVVSCLPVTRGKDESASIHRLRPFIPEHELHTQSKSNLRKESPNGTTDSLASSPLHDIEPVVEWCMQNQRLRATTSDVYSLEKGKDVLSSSVWSPGDESITDTDGADGQSYSRSRSGAYTLSSDLVISTTPRTVTTNWLKPYLTNDSPEWTDMTCTLKMVRDRVMLPDDR
uniref:Uncharacterized protein n=1 Tax=Odontella aurita TaxID=265563 RepID=A0A7S4MS40_9STRA|mmetsp:Transcript_30345/g.90404  ORF Transcript_30345/g.90404 Transcript_30345/m.90404 type:complete len:1897 (+) Transcript_30345:342-6032(+)